MTLMRFKVLYLKTYRLEAAKSYSPLTLSGRCVGGLPLSPEISGLRLTVPKKKSRNCLLRDCGLKSISKQLQHVKTVLPRGASLVLR